MHRLDINNHAKAVADSFRALPRRYYAIGGILFIIVLTAAVFWPRQVAFSYAGRTCFYQPTLLPGLLRSRSDTYRLEADQRFRIGDVTLAALNMCVVPTKAPEEGTTTARLYLAGAPWLQKSYAIVTPDAPTASVSALGQKPLSVRRTVMIPLSAADSVFDYRLQAGGKTAACSPDGSRLSCDLAALSLKQGTAYTLELQRYFGGAKVATIAKRPVMTLTATTVTASSVANGQVVYAKPNSIELTADKEIAEGDIKLVRIETDKRTEIPVTAVYNGHKATISWTDDLPRQAKYEVVASKLIARDGSGLDGTYTLVFETSGGPKVKSISVGNYKVPLGATAVIAFDQPLLAAQDLAKAVAVTGGATIASAAGDRLYISLAGAARCGDISVTVTDNLQSEHGITGGSAWRYAGRMICQAQSTIGVSVRGRPITAYSFGSGGATIVYTGAIHGSEASTRTLMLRWIDELEANARSIPADKTIIVIPAVNPDGYAAGTRTNARNVDLNRNFATADWRSDITTTSNAPFPGGGGSAPLSEPESRALAAYIGRVRPRLVLSYHSIGGLLAANQAGDSLARAATYARLSGYRNTTGASDTFEYGISGTADDYYGEVLGVPSLLIELGSHTDPQFARNRDAMWAMIR